MLDVAEALIQTWMHQFASDLYISRQDEDLMYRVKSGDYQRS